MKKVSIITPTFNRHNFLPHIERCFLDQTYSDLEWLILDDSPEPSRIMAGSKSPKIRYIHSRDRLSIGAKRNLLIEKANGDFIVHFDDDDYYGPNYVNNVLKLLDMHDSDLAILSGFFVIDLNSDLSGYYLTKLKQGVAYRIYDGNARLIQLDDINIPLIEFCFGFSYVYNRSVWDNTKFGDIDKFEDRGFALQAAKRFRILHYEDRNAEVLHAVHGRSTSNCFPQFLLPSFIIEKLNKPGSEYLKKLKAIT